jgi:hypothetical protein
LSLINMFGLSSNVRIAHIACYCKFFLLYYTQVLSVDFKIKVTMRLTASQSVSLGVEPHLGLMTRYSLLFFSYGLVFLWGALSDERTGLSFVRVIACISKPFVIM